MTPEQLAAIRERADNATPGPWEYVNDYIGVRQVPTEAHRTGRTEYEVEGIIPGEHVRESDAAFIAAARTDIPALLDHVDELDEAATAFAQEAHSLSADNVRLGDLLRDLDARIEAARELHQSRPNSVSALYPEPLCTCGKTFPCPTIKAINGD